MFAALLHCCRFGKKLPFGKGAVQHQHIGHRGMTGSDRARLIKNDRVHTVEVFQAFRRLDKDPHFRRFACSHHDGHRSSQPQSAGAGNYKHRDSVGQGEFKPHPCDHPNNGSNQGNPDNYRHEYTADFISQPSDRCFGIAGLIHQTNNLGQSSVLSHFGGPKTERTVFVDSCGDHLISRPLFYGDTLSGNSSLVYVAVAFCHHTIHRDTLTRANNYNISRNHFFCRNSVLLTISNDHCGFGCQIHQLTQSVSCLGLRLCLQIFPHRHQSKDHGGRLKIQCMSILVNHFHITMTKPVRQPEHCEQTVH
ncbi:putative uncharacterized protein [Clostridium sp. CAG:1013]|nr:putative uncharacterized protein [Clostridium sp. CAG:1013]